MNRRMLSYRPVEQKLPPTEDQAVLQRLDMDKLTDEELGRLVRYMVRRDAQPCEAAGEFFTYCDARMKHLNKQSSIEEIAEVKLQIVEEAVYRLRTLPGSHFVTLFDWSYPYHQCVQDVFMDAMETIAILQAGAYQDFVGLVLGMKRKWRPHQKG